MKNWKDNALMFIGVIAVVSLCMNVIIIDSLVRTDYNGKSTNNDTTIPDRTPEDQIKYEDNPSWGSSRLTDEYLAADWLKLPNSGNITFGAGYDIEMFYNATTNQVEWSGGNATHVENVTAYNLWIPVIYYAHTHKNISVDTPGEWYNVTFDSHQDANWTQGINHIWNDSTNDTFTITVSGAYRISWMVAFEDTDQNTWANISTRIYRYCCHNTTWYEAHGSVRERDSERFEKDMSFHNDMIYWVDEGDKIKIQFTSSDTTVSLTGSAAYGDTPSSATISIERVA